MKNIARLNTYLKLAIISMIAVVLAAIANILLLFEIYGLALSEDKDAALAKLHTIETMLDITSVIIYGGLILFIVLLLAGVIRMTKHDTKK